MSVKVYDVLMLYTWNDVLTYESWYVCRDMLSCTNTPYFANVLQNLLLPSKWWSSREVVTREENLSHCREVVAVAKKRWCR